MVRESKNSQKAAQDAAKEAAQGASQKLEAQIKEAKAALPEQFAPLANLIELMVKQGQMGVENQFAVYIPVAVKEAVKRAEEVQRPINEALIKSLDTVQGTVQELQGKVEAYEIRLSMNELFISGIPETELEKDTPGRSPAEKEAATCSVVTQFLTEDMQLQLGTGANIGICSAYRVGKSAGAGGRPRAIVLKVGSAEQQQAILRQKKNVVQRLKEKKVWVDPSLTKSEQQRKKEIKGMLAFKAAAEGHRVTWNRAVPIVNGEKWAPPPPPPLPALTLPVAGVDGSEASGNGGAQNGSSG